jgi:hypothetical protein
MLVGFTSISTTWLDGFPEPPVTVKPPKEVVVVVPLKTVGLWPNEPEIVASLKLKSYAPAPKAIGLLAVVKLTVSAKAGTTVTKPPKAKAASVLRKFILFFIVNANILRDIAQEKHAI